MMRFLVLLALLGGFLFVTRADVTTLDIKAYQKQVMEASDDWILLLLTGGSTDDQAIEALSAMHEKGFAKYGLQAATLDCTDPKARKHCNTLIGSQGTVPLRFISGHPEKNPYTGKLYRKSDPYTGSINEGTTAAARGFDKFVKQILPTLVEPADNVVALSDVQSASAASSRDVLLFVSDKGTANSFVRQVCFRVRATHQCAIAGGDAVDIRNKVGATETLPNIFVLPKKQEAAAVLYEGDVKNADDVVDWVVKTHGSGGDDDTGADRSDSSSSSSSSSSSDEAPHPVFSDPASFDHAMTTDKLYAGAPVVVAVVPHGMTASDDTAIGTDWGLKSKRKLDGIIRGVELRCRQPGSPSAVNADDDEEESGNQTGLSATLCRTQAPALVLLPPQLKARVRMNTRPSQYTESAPFCRSPTPPHSTV